MALFPPTPGRAHTGSPMDFPQVAPLVQVLDQPTVRDVAAEVRRRWQASRVVQQVRRGDRVAVAVGSRGIANLAAIVRATLDVFHDLGAHPFVVAAMGSHGGATPAGQRQLLAEYGITEAALRVPVRTDMDVVQVGTNAFGQPVWWDRNAWQADAVVTVSRVKPHTDFRGRHESGILKMLVIGLGKRDGANQHHRFGVRGLREFLPASGRVVLEKTRFLGGLAVLENAREETARLQVVERDEVLEIEPQLLEEARGLMGRLPFEQLDLLVIGEIGKNYSGAGIDPNVVGRLLMECQPELESPRITRVCALDLSPESHGNGTGVGLADLSTDRLLAQIDPVPFRMNNLTACFLWRSKLPFSFPTDRECLEAGLATCWQPDRAAVRLALIPNTLELAELWVSAPLLAEARGRPDLRIQGEPRPLPFDAAGNLEQEKLFPNSVRGRRPRGG
jgi:antitoxin (DNA-binding transcriptional repressor) of toxin-antitoxin stability system